MTTPTNIKVGGEVDAHCNKCELNLAHTIIAMVGPKIVKVECLTCHNVHAYKGEQPLVKAQGFSRPRTSKAKAKTPKAEKVVISWETQLQGKDVARAKKYSAKETYTADDVVDHPTFGLGFVTAVRGAKVDVSFKADVKTLVHVPPGPTVTAKLPQPRVAAPLPANTPVRTLPPVDVHPSRVETEPVKEAVVETAPVHDSPVKIETDLEAEAQEAAQAEAEAQPTAQAAAEADATPEAPASEPTT